MNGWERQKQGGPRPIAAGLLIALAAPPLGMSVILAWFAAGQGEFSLGYVPVQSALPASYYLGGIQAAVAGTLIGWTIHRRGWVGRDTWTVLTVLLALAPVVVLMLIGVEPGKGALLYVSNVKIACYLIAATLSASLVLRMLIIALGWMLRPA